MRPSTVITALAPVFRQGEGFDDLAGLDQFVWSPGEKASLQGAIWLGWISVLPSKPRSLALATHSALQSLPYLAMSLKTPSNNAEAIGPRSEHAGARRMPMKGVAARSVMQAAHLLGEVVRAHDQAAQPGAGADAFGDIAGIEHGIAAFPS